MNKTEFSDKTSKSFIWLAETVLPQIVKWAEESSESLQHNQASLSLVSNEKYYSKYNELKSKYGKEMVKVSYYLGKLC